MTETLLKQFQKILSFQEQLAPNKSAQVLQAVNEVVVEKDPVAYFASLITLFEQTIISSQDEDLIASIIYLLSLSAKSCPTTIVRIKFKDVAQLLVDSIEIFQNSELVMVQLLLCFGSMLKVLDSSSWSDPFTKTLLQLLLQYSFDKHDQISETAKLMVVELMSAPCSPALFHPAMPTVVDFCLRIIKEFAKSTPETAFQSLLLLKSVSVYIPAGKVLVVYETILQLPPLNHSFLTIEVFRVLSKLAHSGKLEEKNLILMKRLLKLSPNKESAQLVPEWQNMMLCTSKAFIKSSPQFFFPQYFQEIFNAIFHYFESSKPIIIKQTTNVLKNLISCIDLVEENAFYLLPTLISAADIVQEALISFKFQEVLPSVLKVLEEWYQLNANINLKDPKKDLKLGKSVKYLDKLISQATVSPESKAAMMHSLGRAAHGLGITTVLEIVPLNLIPSVATGTPRAWMLPLIREHVQSCTDLDFFRKVLIPLANQVQDRGKSFADEGRAIESRVHETLFQQIWSLFPIFLTVLPNNFTENMVALGPTLLSLLQSDPDLRPTICSAFNALFHHIKSIQDPTTVSDPLSCLKSCSESYLNALLAVINTTDPSKRSYLLETMSHFFSVSEKKLITTVFTQTMKHVLTLTSNPGMTPDASIQTAMDIILKLIPFLDSSCFGILYKALKAQLFLHDVPLQKKAYRGLNLIYDIMPHGRDVLLQNLQGEQGFVSQVAGAGKCIRAGAKKERIHTLQNVISILPNSEMNVIPVILQEAILNCKEVNEKTRSMAFDLLIQIGEKMESSHGVTISLSDNDPMSCSLDLYLQMTMTGLVGLSPHMISATVAALSKIMHHFDAKWDPNVKVEVTKSILLLMKSNQKEIIKTTLGYIKVVVATFSKNDLENLLPVILKSIFEDAGKMKQQFKVKIRHIIEKLVSKFSIEQVQPLIPEKDHKLIQNIRKRRERQQRKQKADPGEATNVTQKQPVSKFGNAFEDILYGSDSDLSNDEIDDHLTSATVAATSGRKKRQESTMIKEDDEEEEMLDFLDPNAVTKVVAMPCHSNSVKREPRDLSKGFQHSNGRLIFQDEEEDSTERQKEFMEVEVNLKSQRLMDQTSDGYQVVGRRVKFNKGSGVKRNLEDLDEDENMEEYEGEPIMEGEGIENMCIEDEGNETSAQPDNVNSKPNKKASMKEGKAGQTTNMSRKEILKLGGQLRTKKTQSGKMMKQRTKKGKYLK